MQEKFKTCIANGRERYWDGQERSVAFPESLLDFLYWDMKKVEADFRKLSVIAQRECESIETILSYFRGNNAYFGLLLWSWQHRRPCESVEQWMRQLKAMPKKLARLQRQALDLFDHVLNTDLDKQTPEQRMAAYYADNPEYCIMVYKFQPQRLYYEMYDGDTFAEVLYPDSIYDLIDYHLKECIRRGVKLRKCKNCGRYFVVSGHGGAEYCDRSFNGGRTCKETGVCGCGRLSITRMSCFGSTAGSTRSGLPVSAQAAPRRSNSTHGASRPERKRKPARPASFRAWSLSSG